MDEDFWWYLKVKCGNCGEISEKWQYVRLMGSVHLHQILTVCLLEFVMVLSPTSKAPVGVERELRSEPGTQLPRPGQRIAPQPALCCPLAASTGPHPPDREQNRRESRRAGAACCPPCRMGGDPDN
ncbi:hypothetical protein ACRRTK_020974 [Alexandromys fortis]